MQEDAPFGTHRRTKTGYGNSTTPPGNAAAYLSDSLVGALIFGFAVCTKPEPGPSALAALTGPDTPPGWSYNPSAWTQCVPILATALIGLFVARYLAAYQLGHIPHVWDPFFPGSPSDPQNGTEEVITSALSRSFPVSDAALGSYTYLLEILTGLVGHQRNQPQARQRRSHPAHRQRTRPRQHHQQPRRQPELHAQRRFCRT